VASRTRTYFAQDAKEQHNQQSDLAYPYLLYLTGIQAARQARYWPTISTSFSVVAPNVSLAGGVGMVQVTTTNGTGWQVTIVSVGLSPNHQPPPKLNAATSSRISII